MTTLLNPYLAFEREAREAMNFYHGVFGGDLVVSTFADGGMVDDPADAERIMHAQLTTADGHTIMASDTPPTVPAPERGQQISLSGDDAHLLTRYWESLGDGARILEPLMAAYSEAPYVSLWLDTSLGQNVGNALNTSVVEMLAGQGSPEKLVETVSAAAARG